jgi:hypothetical protein
MQEFFKAIAENNEVLFHSLLKEATSLANSKNEQGCEPPCMQSTIGKDLQWNWPRQAQS